MLITETAITGSEYIDVKASNPEYALINFYRAFNRADIDLMSGNWGLAGEQVAQRRKRDR